MKFGNDPKMSESKKNITQVKVQFKFAIDLTLSEVGFLYFNPPPLPPPQKKICYRCSNLVSIFKVSSSAGIYLFKVNNGNTKTMCEIRSKLTIKTPERRQLRRSSVFIVNFNTFHTLFCCFHYQL